MISYEPEVCRMTGVSPVAATLADQLLIKQYRGVEPTQEDMAELIGVKKSTISNAYKELRETGLMGEDGRLDAYIELIELNKEEPDVPILELRKATVAAFNKLNALDGDMPTYRDDNRTILNYIKALIKHPMANVLVPGKDKHESLRLRIEGVIKWKWDISGSDPNWKKFVRPATLLRSPSKFYDTYLTEARNHHIRKNR